MYGRRVHTMLVNMLVVLQMMMQEQLTTSEHTSVPTCARVLKNFNFFSASDARRMNLQLLYTLAKVLLVFCKCYEYFISVASVLSRNGLFEFSSTTIYQISIVCTPFSMNQHTNMLAVGICLLAY